MSPDAAEVAGPAESMPVPGPAESMPVPGPAEGIAVPAPDAAARAVFAGELETAQRYAALLADTGVAHGHLGPREIPRLWERHLVNCALVTDLLPPTSRVIDVGSGAGLPGLALAIRRPDLSVELVEPMQRRVDFLRVAVGELGLGDRVRVWRGRAEEARLRSELPADAWVTARAVAPLDRLVEWCLPLVGAQQQFLALKGASVHAEVDEHRAVLAGRGAVGVEVRELRDPSGTAHAWVVAMRRAVGQRGKRGDRRG